ncbi:hypothetical protein A9Q84_00025 [Halobacteriovorax marinus]|uniref:ParB-like N-terminal domain-containing protein n=1 Tax=Halobacteriovorax marinus TaxID=97084 RepID=A0A1Y5FIS5_9BACT|nr:hypothetical protein A9Q84_00025 [Halobacteriovorax marinus]
MNVLGRKNKASREKSKMSLDTNEAIQINSSNMYANINIYDIKLDRERFQTKSAITDETINRMAKSIYELGQLDPIILLKEYKNGKEQFTLVAGETRLRGKLKICEDFENMPSVLANHSKIFAKITEDEKYALQCALETNIVRENTHEIDMFVEFLRYKSFSNVRRNIEENNPKFENKEIEKHTQEEVSKVFKVSQTTVSRWMAWKPVPIEVRAEIIKFDIKNRDFCSEIKKDFKIFSNGKHSAFEELNDLVNFWIEKIHAFASSQNSSFERVEDANKSLSDVPRNFLYYRHDLDEYKIRENVIRNLDKKNKKRLIKAAERLIAECKK